MIQCAVCKNHGVCIYFEHNISQTYAITNRQTGKIRALMHSFTVVQTQTLRTVVISTIRSITRCFTERYDCCVVELKRKYRAHYFLKSSIILRISNAHWQKYRMHRSKTRKSAEGTNGRCTVFQSRRTWQTNRADVTQRIATLFHYYY